jgi:proteasome lid subunit RPN8/RPN11
MRIPQRLVDEIIQHALEDAPNECCGIVAGTAGGATRVHRARNAFGSPLRYEVHPQDLFRITTEIDERGEEVVGIYHSHTQSAAYPSQTDVNLATGWPDPVYLICSVAGDEPDLRGFVIRNGQIADEELVIE